MALAARDLRALLADFGMNSLGHGLDEIECASGLERGAHLVLADLGVAERDICKNRVVEQNQLLRHIADHRPPGLERVVLQRPAVHQDLAAIRGQKADHQIRDRGLARA